MNLVYIRGIDFEVQPGNPGAIALFFHGAQGGVLRRCARGGRPVRRLRRGRVSPATSATPSTAGVYGVSLLESEPAALVGDALTGQSRSRLSPGKDRWLWSALHIVSPVSFSGAAITSTLAGSRCRGSQRPRRSRWSAPPGVRRHRRPPLTERIGHPARDVDLRLRYDRPPARLAPPCPCWRATPAPAGARARAGARRGSTSHSGGDRLVMDVMPSRVPAHRRRRSRTSRRRRRGRPARCASRSVGHARRRLRSRSFCVVGEVRLKARVHVLEPALLGWRSSTGTSPAGRGTTGSIGRA